MWVNKRGDKKQAHNYYKQHTEPARWRLGGEEEKKKKLLQECQTVSTKKKISHLLFSPSAHFKVDHTDTRIKK